MITTNTNTSHPLYSLYFPHCVDAKCYQNLGFSNVNNFILLYWITFVKTHWFVLILNAIVLVMLKVKNAVLK